MIKQCWTNGKISLKCGAIKIRYNIRCIKPYKYDTNVEDINAKKMCDDVNIRITRYIQFCIYIKYWKKIYNWMRTETFNVDAYHLCNVKFFITTSLHSHGLRL